MSGQADPGFGSALMQFIAAAPGHITINSLARTNEEQAALYAKDPTIAAKPGSSWHERGLAGDLGFDSESTKAWAHAHAREFGLFFPMSWEPWHIQPSWTEGRRSTQDGQVADAFTPARTGDPVAVDAQANQEPVGATLGNFMSLLSAPEGIDDNHSFDNALGTFTSAFAPNQPADAGVQDTGVSAQTGTAPTGGTNLNYQGAYNLLIQNGATPAEARILAAVAGPESGYNTHSHNTNASTGDNSYGLWQINMLGNLGPARRRSLGLTSNDDLFDPNVNARAAVSIMRGPGGLGNWTGYNSGAYRKYLT